MKFRESGMPDDTPRGPSRDIRPTPKRITEWTLQEGFHLVKQVDLEPYHYGLVFQKCDDHAPINCLIQDYRTNLNGLRKLP